MFHVDYKGELVFAFARTHCIRFESSSRNKTFSPTALPPPNSLINLLKAPISLSIYLSLTNFFFHSLTLMHCKYL